MPDLVTGASLVTGAGGFAGRHLLRHLHTVGEVAYGIGHNAPIYADLRVRDHIDAVLERLQPRTVYHLAGTSTAAEFQRDPTNGNVNAVQPAVLLMESMLQHTPAARLVLVSTAQVHGRPNALPVTATSPLAPTDLYSSARAAVEYMVRSYRDRGLDVVIARAFPHTGPGRDRRCLTGDWAARLAAGELRIPVPDLSLRRDWSDVRDVVAGYHTLAAHAPRNGTFILCSGAPRPLADIFDLLTLGNKNIVPERIQDPTKEPPVSFGDPAPARALGWTPRFTLEDTIHDLRQWALDPDHPG